MQASAKNFKPLSLCTFIFGFGIFVEWTHLFKYFHFCIVVLYCCIMCLQSVCTKYALTVTYGGL